MIISPTDFIHLTSLKDLADMQDAENKKKYPTMPDYARVKSKFSESNANNLTAAIMKFLTSSGHHVSRVNTMGVVRNGKYTKGGGTIGASDLSVIMKSFSGKIVAWELEVKHGKDVQSDVQKEYESSVVKAGGIYSIVKTYDEFQIQYQKLMNT